MDETGLSEDAVLSILKRVKKEDFEYNNGRILSSMCTSPHPFYKKMYSLFTETNLGDAGLFKGTKKLEEEVIEILGSLLNSKDAWGYILSGGTEANIMALWVARNMHKKKNPEMIIPESAHFSFEKAADILGLRLVKAGLREDHTVDIEKVEKQVNENTIGILGVAGTTEYGAIDDIEALSRTALNNDLYLHIDAAFGGFVIPFLRDLGYKVKAFDFSVKGVNSITIDPHKMGLAPIPSGGILFRNKSFLRYIETPSPYLTERKQSTLTGTRSGASIASTYAVIKLLGREGYRTVVKRCMSLTIKLYNELKNLGIEVLKPQMNILVFTHKKQDAIFRGLTKRGWIVSRTRKGEIRLVIMPHVTEERVEEFIKDLKEILKRL